MKSKGQIGYEAYAASTGGKTYNGLDMPTWMQVQANSPRVAQAWEDAASVIASATVQDAAANFVQATRREDDGPVGIRMLGDDVVLEVENGNHTTGIRASKYNAARLFGLLALFLQIPLPTKLGKAIKL